MSATQKLFFGPCGTGTLVCPHCGKARTVDSCKFGQHSAFKVKCSCGQSFTVKVEKRANYRKAADLRGKIWETSEYLTWDIDVTNLSTSGLCFRFAHDDDDRPKVEIGHRLFVGFRLDDEKRSYVKCPIIIRNIREGAIGAEFVFTDEHTRKQLGFYMMP